MASKDTTTTHSQCPNQRNRKVHFAMMRGGTEGIQNKTVENKIKQYTIDQNR